MAKPGDSGSILQERKRSTVSLVWETILSCSCEGKFSSILITRASELRVVSQRFSCVPLGLNGNPKDGRRNNERLLFDPLVL